jgi:ERF superfamily
MSDETRVAYPPERKALHAALAAAQGEFPPIPREKTVDTGKYTFSYAPLDAIIAAVRPVLAKHGLAVTQALENMNGQPAIRTQILHSDGERIAASFPLGSVPDSVQQLGSKLTYLRRYALCSMLCLAAEDDDDGGASAATPAPKTSGRRRAPVMAPATTPEGPPLPSEDKPGPAQPISQAHARRLHAAFQEKGITDRGDRLSYVEAVIGRYVASSNELTDAEALRLIDHLADYVAYDSETWPSRGDDIS